MGNNYLGSSAVHALTQAVKSMSKLASLKAFGIDIGSNSPSLFEALQVKKSLSVLDLSNCFLNDTIQMSDLLQTIPNLEVLDLSHNQLTNGSVLARGLSTLLSLKSLDLSYNNLTDKEKLAPAFSNLRNFKSLYLEGNNFTTKDRLAVWNAVRFFLAQSPFPLDDDLTFATTYLQSFPANKTSLNLAGLVLNNSTAFETIMPIIVNHFTNLRELDLSGNDILDWNSAIPEERAKGIEALNISLPHLKDLQSLKMSNCYGSDAAEADSYYQSFSQTIGQLPLHSLDLSGTCFFNAASLGQGLSKNSFLRSVNLEGCWFNWTCATAQRNWQGGVQLLQGLQTHPSLTHLDLSWNPIGKEADFLGNPDPNSTYALANALPSWPQLQSLNLAENWIGYKDPNSSSYFLEKLANLSIAVYNKTGKTLEVNLLNGIYNIIWTNESYVFQNLTEQPIIKACARQLCSGGNITTQSKTKAPKLQEKPHVEQKALTSSTSHLVPFYQPLVNSLKPWFSLESWSTWGDRKLDYVIHVITSYSEKVVKNAPGYYPGTLGRSKSPVEGRNKTFYNYPIPHFRSLDQGEPLDVQQFNLMQGLSQTPVFNHTSSPLMLSTGSQTLMITK